MADEKEPEGDGAADGWTLDEVKELLAKFGVVIPDSATTKEAVIAVADAMSGAWEEEEPEAGAETVTDAMMATQNTEDPQAQLSLWRERAEKAARKLKLVRKQQADEKEQVFRGSLRRLRETGRITAADEPGLIEAGQASSWRFSLAPYERLPEQAAVPRKSVVQQGASAEPPAVGGDNGKKAMTDDRAKEIAKSTRR